MLRQSLHVDGSIALTMPRWLAAPGQVAYDGSVTSAALPAGTHLIIATTDCHFLQGPSTVVAVGPGAGASHYLPADTQRLVKVTTAVVDGYIAAIKKTTAGTLYISYQGD